MLSLAWLENEQSSSRITNLSIHLVVRANIYQHDQVVAAGRVRFKSKNNSAVVLYPASPQSLQLSMQLVCFQLWLKGILGQYRQDIQNTLLQKWLAACRPFERTSKAGIPDQASHGSLSRSRRKTSTVP